MSRIKTLINAVRRLVGKNRGVGSLTTTKLLGNLRIIASFMASQGLQSIHHLKSKHVQKFFEHMIAQNRSPSTLSAYATAMRLIAVRINKHNIVPRRNADLGFVRTGRYCPLKRDHEKAAMVRQELYRKGRWAGLAYDMQVQYGLRRKESLLSVETREVDGLKQLVVLGAKGGRPRFLAFETTGQEEILKQVQDFVHDNGWSSLIPPNLTLIQGLRKISNWSHRAGGTKKNQANLHRNRHAKAQRLKADGKSDAEAMDIIGHIRPKAIKHYCE